MYYGCDYTTLPYLASLPNRELSLLFLHYFSASIYYVINCFVSINI